MRKISCFLWLLTFHLGAQNIPVDTWRSHYSYTSGRILEVANETIFCAAENGLFSLSMDGFSTRKFGKESGLGGARVTALHFVPDLQVLVVGYESGLIDLIYSDGNITTIRTVRDAPIVAEKSIKSIAANSERAYLATGFGVVYLDLVNERVVESYRSIGVGGAQLSIDEVLVSGDSLYIISEQGIQAGSFDDNLLDFNDWVVFDETNSGVFRHLVSHDGKLFVVEDGDQLWSFDGAIWSSTGLVFEAEVKSFYSGSSLFALTNSKIFSVDETINLELDEGAFLSGNDLVITNDYMFVADGDLGLLAGQGSLVSRNPVGPISDYPTKMQWLDGTLYSVFGPSPLTYNGTFDEIGYSKFSKGSWENEAIGDFSNITDVASIGGNLFFSSMGHGLYDYDNGMIFNDTNSPLEVSTGVGTVDLTSLESYGNSLWITANNTSNSIIKYENSEFVAFDQDATGTRYPADLEISNEGVLWIRKGSFEGGGLSVFSPATQEQRSMSTSAGLPSNQTTGFDIDGEDRVWISTTDGLATYDGASFPFNSFNITVPIFQNGFLFEDEQINDVMTDGGDRIWVATLNGVWVLEDDLSEVVARYTSENSPLPSNEIRSFAYDEDTGEVFISTSKGLVSYRSASSKGQLVHSASIKVFPNPVLSGFSGEVGITGLVKNATLKITDVKGRLVKEITANGSSASWDLTTHIGGRVQAGIYLIFSSSDDGQETMVGKIAVLK
ncbi:MAG: hypothetical protein RIF46_15035 [Cyclobacteriaceae bacterium]